MTRTVSLIGVALWMLASTTPSAADTTPFEVKDAGKVYYGDPGEFANPATLVATTVFASIKEWQEIQEKHLTTKDPEYWILLEKANRRFHCAVHRVAQKDGYDLVAETGAVVRKDGKALPDVTAEVVAALDNKENK